MKKLLLGILPIVGAMIMATSCSSVDEDIQNTTGKLSATSFTASIDTQTSSFASSAKSRVTYTGESTLTLSGTWDVSDVISVTNGTNAYDFTSTNSTAGTEVTTDFTGTSDFTDGQKLYAYYPKPASISSTSAVYNFTTATLTINSTDGLAAASKNYPMYASQNYAKGGTTAFKFTGAGSILKVKIQAPKGGNIANISIKGPNLKTSGTLGTDGTWTSTSNTTATTATLTSGNTVKQKDEIDLYVITVPGSTAANATVTITYDDGTKYYTKLTDTTVQEAKNEYVTARGIGKISGEAKIGMTYYSDGTWGWYNPAKDKDITTSATMRPVGIICALSDQMSEKDKAAGYSTGYVMCTLYPGQSVPWTSSSYTKDEFGTSDMTTINVANLQADQNGYTYQTTFESNHSKDIFANPTVYDDNMKQQTAFYYSKWTKHIKETMALSSTETNSGWFLPSAGQIANMLVNLGSLNMKDSLRNGTSAPQSDGAVAIPVKFIDGSSNNPALVLENGNSIDQNTWPHHLTDAMWFAAPKNYTDFSNTSMWSSNEVDTNDAIILVINGTSWTLQSTDKTSSGLVRPFLAF